MLSEELPQMLCQSQDMGQVLHGDSRASRSVLRTTKTPTRSRTELRETIEETLEPRDANRASARPEKTGSELCSFFSTTAWRRTHRRKE